MYKLGLTGSIGMGKSTTLAFFAELGCPVWDADAAVHRLYSKGGAAVAPIRDIAPSAIIDGFVDREELKKLLHNEKIKLADLEKVVHPLVTGDRANFVKKNSKDIVVFDIPLLFETADVNWFDGIAVVTAPPEIQYKRVLSRPDMTEEQYNFILSRQMPDLEKCAKADFIIETISLEKTKSQVYDLIKLLKKENNIA